LESKVDWDSSTLIDALQRTRGRRDRPWHSRFLGIALLAIADFALICGMLIVIILGILINGGGAVLLLFGGFILWFVWAFLGYGISPLKQIAKKLYEPDALELLKTDRPRPVVYPRPFTEDALEQRQPEPEPYIYKALAHQPYRPQETREQIIETILKQIGPFVAVGSPRDRLAPFGAARIYLSDDEWQENVKLLVEAAAAIVLKPEGTDGVRWELNLIANSFDLRRLLILVPNSRFGPTSFIKVKNLLSAQLGISLPETDKSGDAFMFDNDRKPILLSIQENGSGLEPFAVQTNALNNEVAPRLSEASA
jgi:hypothetical protein